MSKDGSDELIVRERTRVFSLLFGMFPVLLMGGILLVAAVTFAMGKTLSWFQFVFSFLLSLGLVFFWARRRMGDRKRVYFLIGGIVLLLVVSVFVSGFYYDLSHDGRLYHQNSVIQLANGWSPFIMPYWPDGLHPAYKLPRRSIWTVVYPKSAELCAASLYKITGNIQHGKAFNIMLLVGSFFLALAALLKITRLKLRAAGLYAALAAFNPVTVCMVFSYYIDGQLASVMLCLFALAAMMLKHEPGDPARPYLGIFGLGLIVLINTKFTGLAYAFFIALGVVVWLLIKKRWKVFFQASAVCFIAGVVGFAGVGYQPYATNWKSYGHPLHPIYGKHKMRGLNKKRYLSVPRNLQRKNRFEKFYISQMSRSKFVRLPRSSTMKVPFSVTWDEIKEFRGTSVRIGGFGPWFGGVLLLIILALFAGFLIDWRGFLPYFLFFFFIAGGAAMNHEFWWARLAPQVWLLPLVIILFQVQAKKKFMRIAGVVLTVLLVINTLMVTASYLTYQTRESVYLHKRLDQLSKVDGPVHIDMGIFKSARVMLHEAGVKYVEVGKLPIHNYLIPGIHFEIPGDKK